MHSILTISPQGHLCLREYATSTHIEQEVRDKKIIQAFSQGAVHGLLALANASVTSGWSNALRYWRSFAIDYFNKRCQQDVSLVAADVDAPAPQVLERLALALPPMPGAEYISAAVLAKMWKNLDVWVQNEITTFSDGLSGFLAKYLPKWHQVGRVCFHLAENKNDEDYPFAFLATYVSSMSNNATAQHQPLNYALQEYAGQGNKAQLLKLLKPVYQASKQLEWVKALLETHDLYQALAWRPDEAYRLLRDASILEESGLSVRLPDWWKKRPRPQVQVSIGSAKKSALNLDAMLDFDVAVAFDGKGLSSDELNTLLAANDGLVFLRGQWVEVDSAKLQEALQHWQMVQQEASTNGLNFVEGMRLLSGADSALSGNEASIDENDSWAYVNAGGWLKELLAKLRAPETIVAKTPGTELKATLRPYQTTGVNWLAFLSSLRLGACLADDMGLGKTIQIIALLLLKKKQPDYNEKPPSLLVLPTSLLSNWQAELEKFAPSLTAVYLHPSFLDKKQLETYSHDVNAFQGVDLVLTTYGILLRQTWLLERQWYLLILDEAQAIKNPTTKQTKLCKQLQSEARIALTGTPIENRLGDLWSLFDFLTPGLLGNATRFKAYVKTIQADQQQSFLPLKKLVGPYILRRLKTDKTIINDLPEKTELIAWCGLSKMQTKLYNQSVLELKEAMTNEAAGIKRRGLVLAFLMRFKQICNHPSQALGDGAFLAQDSGKFQRLQALCEEIALRQEKVLIFTQFREMTAHIARLLEQVFNQPGLILHGGTSVKQRKQFVSQFQEEGGAPFFVLSLKAAGVGLNLTAANHVIHFDRWWNPAVENQATDRAFRIGQKKNVLVHKFVCRGTVEEKIHAMIAEKVQLSDNVLQQGAEALLTELDDNALLDLVSLDLDKVQL